jgi:hypothetical protein
VGQALAQNGITIKFVLGNSGVNRSPTLIMQVIPNIAGSESSRLLSRGSRGLAFSLPGPDLPCILSTFTGSLHSAASPLSREHR